MAGEAARICLKATGSQDEYLLSKKPEDSPFFYDGKSIRHADFRKYHRNVNVTNPGAKPTWPFGETIKITFNPSNMGDLLSNMWVSIELPGIANGNYADAVGRHIFERVTMYVDELEVETFYDDWGIIYDELYIEPSEKVARRFEVNRSLAFDTSDVNESTARRASDLLIPINLFFSRKYASDEYSQNSPNRPYFPLCSCWKQKISFEFKFRPQTFFTDFSGTLTLPEFDVITEEITLDPLERMYLMKKEQQLVTDVVRRHPSIQTDPGKKTLKNDLVPNVPVKCLHWFFRNAKFEDEKVVQSDEHTESDLDGEKYIHNRFNFSSNVNFDELFAFYAPVMDTAKIHINGNPMPNSLNTGHVYYKYLVPLHKKLSRPIRNVYTYSFSLNPINAQSSGYLNFAELKSDKTNIEFSFEPQNAAGQALLSDTYTCHMYYKGIEIFVFEDGKMRYATARDVEPSPKRQAATETFKSFDQGKTFVLQEAVDEVAKVQPPIGPKKDRKPNVVDHFLNSVSRLASM